MPPKGYRKTKSTSGEGGGTKKNKDACGTCPNPVLKDDKVIQCKFSAQRIALAQRLAERLAREGATVTYVTPQSLVSAWTEMTNEQHFVQARLLQLGVDVMCNRYITAATAQGVQTRCTFSERQTETPCDTLLLVTARTSNDVLYDALCEQAVPNVARIGDCEVPGAIVHAVYSGHRYARELHEPCDADVPFLRERVLP